MVRAASLAMFLALFLFATSAWAPPSGGVRLLDTSSTKTLTDMWFP